LKSKNSFFNIRIY